MCQGKTQVWETGNRTQFQWPPVDALRNMDLAPLTVKTAADSRPQQEQVREQLALAAEGEELEGVPASLIFPHGGAMPADVMYHSVYARTTGKGFLGKDAPDMERQVNLLEAKKQQWAKDKQECQRSAVHSPKTATDFNYEHPVLRPEDKPFHAKKGIAAEFKNPGACQERAGWMSGGVLSHKARV
jgi:hypothetical protein